MKKQKAKKQIIIKPYKIDKGITLAPISGNTGDGKASKATLTMTLMKAGESFLVKDGLDSHRAVKNMRDLMSRERKTGGKRIFESRQVGAGHRIWRTQ